MTGPRTDGMDELGLAEVAWQLRSTLASAADLPVPAEERVLSTIRRRSNQRRRAKRVLSTSVAAFALSLSTLAVVKGGQVAIDHGINRNAEPPAVTPENTGDEMSGDSPESADDGPAGDDPKPSGQNCRPDPSNGSVPCQPGAPGPTEQTIPTGPGGNDPTSSVPGGPNTTQVPMNTTTAPTRPTPTQPVVTTPPPTTAKPIFCEPITDTVPADPQCFLRAFERGQPATLAQMIPDPSAPGGVIRRLWTYDGAPATVVKVEVPVDEAPSRMWNCPEPTYTGSGPQWYVMGPLCVDVTPRR